MDVLRSPLNIEKYYVKSMHFESSKKPDAQTENKLFVGFESNEIDPSQSKWELEVKIRLLNVNEGNEDVINFEANLALIGIFTIEKIVKKSDQHKLVENGGFSVLYGAARVILANLTAQSDCDKQTLPALSFVPRSKMEEVNKGG